MRARYRITISPDDVGSRVSVRYWLDDAAETSGPRHSDAVGRLEAWTDGWLHIRRRDDSVITVDQAAMVSGKVLPERPGRVDR